PTSTRRDPTGDGTSRPTSSPSRRAEQVVLRAYGRTRLVIGFLAGAAAFPVAMAFLPWQVAVLVGWNVMALVILTWAIAVILRCDSTATEALSVREDDSRFVADVSQVVACVASLLAVGSSLIKAGSEQGLAKAGIIANAVLGVL